MLSGNLTPSLHLWYHRINHGRRRYVTGSRGSLLVVMVGDKNSSILKRGVVVVVVIVESLKSLFNMLKTL